MIMKFNVKNFLVGADQFGSLSEIYDLFQQLVEKHDISICEMPGSYDNLPLFFKDANTYRHTFKYVGVNDGCTYLCDDPRDIDIIPADKLREFLKSPLTTEFGLQDFSDLMAAIKDFEDGVKFTYNGEPVVSAYQLADIYGNCPMNLYPVLLRQPKDWVELVTAKIDENKWLSSVCKSRTLQGILTDPTLDAARKLLEPIIKSANDLIE